MIALIRVQPPRHSSGTVELAHLPTPPGLSHSGFIVACSDAQQVHAAIAWAGVVRSRRPRVALGVVARPEHCAGPLARCPFPISPVLSPDELEAGRLPVAALEDVRRRSVVSRIVDRIVEVYGDGVLRDQDTLVTVVEHGAGGGTLTAAARSLGCTPGTVRRRLAGHGISARLLLREVRLAAYALRVELGVERGVALRAGGWTDHDQRRKSRARLRRASGGHVSLSPEALKSDARR